MMGLVENVADDSRWQIKREVIKPRIPRLGRQQGRQGRLGQGGSKSEFKKRRNWLSRTGFVLKVVPLRPGDMLQRGSGGMGGGNGRSWPVRESVLVGWLAVSGDGRRCLVPPIRQQGWSWCSCCCRCYV